MPPVARIGDSGSHGGSIVSGCATTRSDGPQVARVGDTYACPLHGPNPIAAGSSIMKIEGQRVARIGDPTACGAAITSGSPKWKVGG